MEYQRGDLLESGIYCIRNLKNNKIYVGSTKNFHIRWNKHKNDLKINKHCNIILQRSFNKNKHKLKWYNFEIIERCPYNKNILKREDFYIKHYKAKNRKYGYNIADASFGDVLTNHPNKKAIIKKISDSLRKKYQSLTVEERKIKWDRAGKKNGNWKDSIKTKKCPICKNKFRLKKICCSRNCWDAYFSENPMKFRGGKKNPFYGRHHSNETKKILSDKHKGMRTKSQLKPFEIDGVKYISLMEASKKTGIQFTTIRHRINSPNPKFKSYQYISMDLIDTKKYTLN